jgi:hypothetical protein
MRFWTGSDAARACVLGVLPTGILSPTWLCNVFTASLDKFFPPNDFEIAAREIGYHSLEGSGFPILVLKKIVYNMGCQSVGTQGDANQDSMTIFSADGAVATGSVTNFLSTLI